MSRIATSAVRTPRASRARRDRRRGLHVVAERRQDISASSIARILVVVDDQDLSPRWLRRRRRRCARRLDLERAASAAGSRTMKVLPSPRPALRASTSPPCSCDERAHERQPEAEAAVGAVGILVSPARTARTRAGGARGDADPVVADLDDDVACRSGGRISEDVAALVACTCAALLRRFANTCTSRAVVAVDDQRPRRRP